MKEVRLYIAAAVMLFILSGIVIFNSLQNMSPVSEKKPPTEIEFIHWAYFPDEIFDRFYEEHPEIRVNYERYNVEDYTKVTRMRISTDEKTDILGVPPVDYADFAANGYLLNLSGQPFLDGFKQDVRNALKSKFDGSEYAVAYRSTYYGIWYNKTLFDKYDLKEPMNFTQLLQVCSVLKYNGVHPFILGAKDDAVAMYVYFLRLFDLFDDPNWKYNYQTGIEAFDNPANMAKFAQLQALVDGGYIDPNSADLTFLQAFDYFKQSRAGMIIAPDWSIDMTGDDMEKVFEPDVCFIPYTDNEIDVKVPVEKADYLIGIYSGSDKIAESLTFLQFLSRSDIAQLYCDKTISYPTVKGVDTESLPYNRLWEPIRKMEGASTDFLTISRQKMAALSHSTKLFLLGDVRYDELIEAFKKAYAQ